MRGRLVRLLVSLLVAFVAGASLLRQVSGPAIEYSSVVVATQDIDYHEPISASNVAIKRIVASAVPQGALTEIPNGKIASQKVWAGQILLPGMVKAPATETATPEQRVIAIPVSLETAGGIQAGDRVDVILVTTDRSTGKAVAETVVANLEVVRLLNQSAVSIEPGSKDSPSSGKALVPAVAELLVTLDDAKVISAALELGKLRLAQYLPHSRPLESLQAITGAAASTMVQEEPDEGGAR